MTPMCDTTTGEQVGWAIAVATCDGVVTLTYYDVDGAVVDTDLPTDWKTCVQGIPGAEWSPTHTSTSFTSTVNIDFSGAEYVTIPNVTGNLTFTGSNYGSARRVDVKVVETGGSSRTLTFVSGWKFMGVKPTAIAANKTGWLTLIAWGPASTDVTATWRVEV